MSRRSEAKTDERGIQAPASSSRPLGILGKPEARLRISYERGIQIYTF
ncbi:MAG: hypothetical protein HOL16_08105 [Alphaproteobacteria bacterium]|nr:hypothetical protein [Alphaproteobacteria bacterium]